MKRTHAVQISFFLDPMRRTPAQILKDWWPLVVGAEMVAGAGARVTVVQACHETRTLQHNGLHYHFLAPERGHSSIATSAPLGRLLRDLEPDILHVHGLSFPEDVLHLRAALHRVPIYLQDHADRVPRPWRRRRLRTALASAAGVSFCASLQAQPFIRARLLPEPQGHNLPDDVRTPKIFEIPEGSSPFTAGDRGSAQIATGVYGEPAVLWVGHLDANKDPLTVLRGVRCALDHLPQLHLWCCYGSAPLHAQVSACLASDPALAAHVHLLGRVEHSRIEMLMRAADIFVLGSHREGSGGALIEAMATGLSPVVTDIPSFRSLTHGGRVGALWPCDDHRSLSTALVAVGKRHAMQERRRVLDHFAAELAPAAVGAKFLAAYEAMIGMYRDRAFAAAALSADSKA